MSIHFLKVDHSHTVMPAYKMRDCEYAFIKLFSFVQFGCVLVPFIYTCLKTHTFKCFYMLEDARAFFEGAVLTHLKIIHCDVIINRFLRIKNRMRTEERFINKMKLIFV